MTEYHTTRLNGATISLKDVIRRLSKSVAKLQRRVAKLEAK